MKRPAAFALFYVALHCAPVAAGVHPRFSHHRPDRGSEAAVTAEEAERLFATGLYQKAAQTLQAAIAQNPDEAALQYWVGRCFFEMNDFTSASTYFDRAVALRPDSSAYHEWLGRASGRRAEQTNRFNAIAAFGLARKTHREFETAIQLDPRNLEAQRDLIRYLLNAPGIAGGGKNAQRSTFRNSRN